jgi:hypothetical protein
MMPISLPFRNPSLMSPRTVKYVEAMIRQGDGFDHDKWLKRVREEEAQAKQHSAAPSSGQAGAVGQIGNPVSEGAWPDELDGYEGRCRREQPQLELLIATNHYCLQAVRPARPLRASSRAVITDARRSSPYYLFVVHDQTPAEKNLRNRSEQ